MVFINNGSLYRASCRVLSILELKMGVAVSAASRSRVGQTFLSAGWATFQSPDSRGRNVSRSDRDRKECLPYDETASAPFNTSLGSTIPTPGPLGMVSSPSMIFNAGSNQLPNSATPSLYSCHDPICGTHAVKWSM